MLYFNCKTVARTAKTAKEGAKMKISIEERRQAQRFPLEIDFLYRLMRGSLTENSMSGFRATKTKNVSAFGLCVAFKEEIEEGDIIFAKMDIEGRLVECFCEVKWVEYDIESGSFMAGLEFDYISPSNSVLIINYFKKILVE